jgi:hypothetical protein
MTVQEKHLLASIRPGRFHSSYAFVFLWHGGPPKCIPPGAKRTPREGMPVVICGWKHKNDTDPLDWTFRFQSLN